jgi:hypothetical protein
MNILAHNATEFITTVISFTIQVPGWQNQPEKCIRPSAYLMNRYFTNLMEKIVLVILEEKFLVKRKMNVKGLAWIFHFDKLLQ